MKQIKAIIRTHILDDVLRSIGTIEGLPGVMISEIRGFGKSKDRKSPEKTSDGVFMYVERTKLEVVVDDSRVEEVLSAIHKAAHTGNTGDGKVFVIPVDECLKIRTGERGEAAV